MPCCVHRHAAEGQPEAEVLLGLHLGWDGQPLHRTYQEHQQQVAHASRAGEDSALRVLLHASFAPKAVLLAQCRSLAKPASLRHQAKLIGQWLGSSHSPSANLCASRPPCVLCVCAVCAGLLPPICIGLWLHPV